MDNRWIPCGKRLPEDGELVLVTVKMKYGWEKEWEYHTDIGSYSGCNDIFIDGFETNNDWDEGQECHILAWQPLPEPYKED